MGIYDIGYLSRISIDDNTPILKLKKKGIITSNEYALHQLVWKIMSYSPDQKRDFLFRHRSSEGLPEFLVMSSQRPQPNDDLWSIETKKYTVSVNKGDVFNFSLRCNPVITPTEREPGKRPFRLDAVQFTKRQAIAENRRFSNSEIIQEAAVAWLNRRTDSKGLIFNESSIIVEKYAVHPHPKDRDKNISLLDVSGILTVSNEDLFVSALKEGIGHARAWGYGLLLIQRR